MTLRLSSYVQLGYNSKEQLEEIRSGEVFLAHYRGFTWYFREIDMPQVGELPEGVAVFQYYAESSRTTRYKGKFQLVEVEEKKTFCGEELRKYILLKFTKLMNGVNPKTKHNGTSDLGAYIRAIPSEFLADEKFRSKLEATARRVIDNRISKTSNLDDIENLGDLSDYVKEQIVVASGTVKKIDKNTTIIVSAEEIEKARAAAIKQNHRALGDGKNNLQEGK